MHLSLLSDGYVSDSYNDAGAITVPHPFRAAGSVHFVALCRGLIVMLALAIPICMTILTTAKPTDSQLRDELRSIASHAPIHAKIDG